MLLPPDQQIDYLVISSFWRMKRAKRDTKILKIIVMVLTWTLLIVMLSVATGCGQHESPCPYHADRVLECGVAVHVDRERGEVAPWVDDRNIDIAICQSVEAIERVTGTPAGTLSEQDLLVSWTGPGWRFDAHHMSAGTAFAQRDGWDRSWVSCATWYLENPAPGLNQTALLHELAHLLLGPDEDAAELAANDAMIILHGRNPATGEPD